MNLCEVARQAGVERIVYAASGVSRYGAQGVAPWTKVQSRCRAAVGKLAGEMYLRAYAEMYCLAPICLALANVYGPHQSAHGAAGGDRRSRQRNGHWRAVRVYREGAAHDYAYVDVDAFLRAGATSWKIPAHITSVQGGTSASPRSTV